MTTATSTRVEYQPPSITPYALATCNAAGAHAAGLKAVCNMKSCAKMTGFFLLHATLTFTIKEEMLIGSYMAYWGEGFGKWRKQEIPKSTLLQCQAGTHTVKYLLAVM